MTYTLIEDSNTNGTLDTETDTPVAEYRYDGTHRRIAKAVKDGNNWDRTDYYYNESWQVLEERFADNQQVQRGGSGEPPRDVAL